MSAPRTAPGDDATRATTQQRSRRPQRCGAMSRRRRVGDSGAAQFSESDQTPWPGCTRTARLGAPFQDPGKVVDSAAPRVSAGPNNTLLLGRARRTPSTTPRCSSADGATRSSTSSAPRRRVQATRRSLTPPPRPFSRRPAARRRPFASTRVARAQVPLLLRRLRRQAEPRGGRQGPAAVERVRTARAAADRVPDALRAPLRQGARPPRRRPAAPPRAEDGAAPPAGARTAACSSSRRRRATATCRSG